MIIRRDFYIDDLHYILEFQHYSFRFYLDYIPPKYRYHMTRQQWQSFSFWGDEPVFDDLNIHVPALLVFRTVMQLIEEIVQKYRITYWEFSASSLKKAQIYEKLLQSYIFQQNQQCNYIREGSHFYVYPQLNQ